MEELKKSARERFIPIVRDKTAQKLCDLCHEKKPKEILEIGTAIGYSALLMLDSCDAKICTIEKNEERYLEAKRNFEKFHHIDRVEMCLDDAMNVLQNLCAKKSKFDLIFLDGAKGQYIHYYEFIKQLLSPRGILFADNVHLLGLVENTENVTHKNRTMVRNMRAFIDKIKNDKDFDTQFFDIDDGYCIAIKK